jgi:hypothetical protein
MKLFGQLLIIMALLHFKAFGQFKEGHYYEKDGRKVTGLLRFNYGGNAFTDKLDGDCSVTYREDKRGEKVKLTTNDICCFVIEKDSFAVIKNFRLNAFVTYPQDFAKVIQSGKINLYMYYSTVQQGQYGLSTVTDWVIEKDGKADKLTRKRFRELLPTYLSDYPELMNKIDNDVLNYNDSEKIIKMYNEFMRGAR